MRVPTTGGWQAYQDVIFSIQLEAGLQVMRLVMETNGSTGFVGNFNYVRLSAQ